MLLGLWPKLNGSRPSLLARAIILLSRRCGSSSMRTTGWRPR